MDRRCMPLGSCKKQELPTEQEVNSSFHQEFISREICLSCQRPVELVMVPPAVGGKGPSAVWLRYVLDNRSSWLSRCPAGHSGHQSLLLSCPILLAACVPAPEGSGVAWAEAQSHILLLRATHILYSVSRCLCVGSGVGSGWVCWIVCFRQCKHSISLSWGSILPQELWV